MLDVDNFPKWSFSQFIQNHSSLLMFSILVFLLSGCDDPTPGPIGGLVLLVRSYQAQQTDAIKSIASIEIQTSRIEVIHRATIGGAESTLIADSHQRNIAIMNNGVTDRLIGQYQIPGGYVSQIRIFPLSVIIHQKDGVSISLAVPSPNIPSWDQSGWKIEPLDGKPWKITENELIGVRALFHFDESVIFNKGNGYKIKPTVVADTIPVNPTQEGPGVFMDQITVVFHAGVSRIEVEAINSEIGATILREPLVSQAYRMKLPVTINLQDATSFYQGKPSVRVIMPAIRAPNRTEIAASAA